MGRAYRDTGETDAAGCAHPSHPGARVGRWTRQVVRFGSGTDRLGNSGIVHRIGSPRSGRADIRHFGGIAWRHLRGRPSGIAGRFTRVRHGGVLSHIPRVNRPFGERVPIKFLPSSSLRVSAPPRQNIIHQVSHSADQNGQCCAMAWSGGWGLGEDKAYYSAAAGMGPASASTPRSSSTAGIGPPVAQSSSSTV